MHTGAVTSYIDVAQVALYLFFAFFAGLVVWIRREDKREGYPLVSDLPGRVSLAPQPVLPQPKTFLMQDGSAVLAPREEAPEAEPYASPLAAFPGAPLEPHGDPMLAAVGPGSYAMRADVPERMFETGAPKIVPLRADHEFSIPKEDPDPRGLPVVGLDGFIAGTCVDAWVDRSETVLRYFEVELTSGGVVLVPVPFTTIRSNPACIRVRSISAIQFANVPRLANPEQVTKLEEDKICAYYGGGTLYATPGRSEPIL